MFFSLLFYDLYSIKELSMPGQWITRKGSVPLKPGSVKTGRKHDFPCTVFQLQIPKTETSLLTPCPIWAKSSPPFLFGSSENKNPSKWWNLVTNCETSRAVNQVRLGMRCLLEGRGKLTIYRIIFRRKSTLVGIIRGSM